MPCSWSHSFMEWHRGNSKYDLGIHLTHTCKWKNYKWRPLSGYGETPLLYDKDGFMRESVDEEFKEIPVDQIRKEMMIQMEIAQRRGLKISHIDNHMWTVAQSDANLEEYFKLAILFKLTPHIPKWTLWNEERKALVGKYGFKVVDNSISICEANSYEEKKGKLFEKLLNIQSGLNLLTLHPVIDTPEIREIIPKWEERYFEYKLFMEDETEEVIKRSGIKLIAWKDVGNIK